MDVYEDSIQNTVVQLTAALNLALIAACSSRCVWVLHWIQYHRMAFVHHRTS